MQKTFKSICIGIIIGFVFCVMLLGYQYYCQYRYERRRADEYLNALNRSQEYISRVESQLHQQGAELEAALRESELLRTERAELRKSLQGIREQIHQIGAIESGDLDRITRLEAIIGRIIDIATAGTAKSGGQN